MSNGFPLRAEIRIDGISNARTEGGERLRAPMKNRSGRVGDRETGHCSKARKRKRAAPGVGYACPRPRSRQAAWQSKIALPVDLGRSLGLLDDAQLDRLMEAVTEELRRRGRNPPDSPSVPGRSAKRIPAKAGRAKPDEPSMTASVTPGQERLILAAFEAGPTPAAIAKEVRASRSTVQHVITAAQRDRRKTER